MDRDAEIADLYREQYRPLVRYLCRMLGDIGQAEEIAQEAFVRALQHRPEHTRAWVYRVATNLARDVHRRAAVRRQHLRVVKDGATSDVQAPHEENRPDEKLERRERDRRVRAALNGLTDRDRDALLLWEEGMSYDDIARTLELSRGSIGTTLSRARRRLAQAYRKLETTSRPDDTAKESTDVSP